MSAGLILWQQFERVAYRGLCLVARLDPHAAALAMDDVLGVGDLHLAVVAQAV